MRLNFQIKLAIVFVIVAIATTATCAYIVYREVIAIQKAELQQKILTIATLGSYLIDAAEHKRIPASKEGVQAPEYKNLRRIIRKIVKSDSHIKYVYTMIKGDRPNIWKFIIDSDEEEACLPGTNYDVSRFKQMQKAFKGPSVDNDITTDQWGSYLSGYAPIRDENGEAVAIIGVDVLAKTIKEMDKQIRNDAVKAVALSVPFALFLSFIISFGIVRPIKKLSLAMDKVKKGDFTQRVSVKTNDELSDLGEDFNVMTKDLKNYMQELEKTTAEKERLKRELEIARELQESILPDSPPKVEGLDVDGICVPAREVGGDIFDYVSIDSLHAGFIIGDAAGKGLGSAIYMSQSLSIFKAFAIKNIDTAGPLKRANSLIVEEFKRRPSFMTLFYAVYDTQKKILSYTNCGHNKPIAFFASKNTAEILQGPAGLPLGIMEGEEIPQGNIALNKGDVIVFYTDGISEARNEQNELYTEERLRETILKNASQSAGQIVKTITQSVFSFVGKQHQYDDLTLLVLKVIK
ncbi:MAG: SpoIIE family protein phosphatase [Candidatus Omnitrophota bacterium]